MTNKEFLKSNLERIKSNIDKFESGEWTIKGYCDYYGVKESRVQTALNEAMDEKLQEYRMLCYIQPQKLPRHYYISEVDLVEIQPKETHDLGDKIEVIYESKLNKQ